MLSSKMFFLNVSHGMGIIIIMTWSRAWSWAWTWKYRTWKFCTWKCHTVHIDVHVYFFAVNLVLVGLRVRYFPACLRLSKSCQCQIVPKPTQNFISRNWQGHCLLILIGMCFSILWVHTSKCAVFLLFFILITFSSLVSFHISLL